MKEIIKLILKYHFTIFFVALEIGSFFLIVNHNNYQKTVFAGCMASLSNILSSTVTEVKDYFYLKITNDKLVAENTNLRNQLEELKARCRLNEADTLWKKVDSSAIEYVFKTAEIVNAGFNKTKNYITIDKGTADGVQPEMAVCSSEGVIGIVEKVSKHYAKVLPLINTNLRVSAKIKKNGYYGSLQWDGVDYRYSYLNDIPFHVNVEVGDTIVTSGFSTIFPESELIGFVKSVNRETANFISIKVKLATDFKKILDVYVIAHTKREEQHQLENEI